jgi:hypothetical protein
LWLKILKILCCGSGIRCLFDPGSRREKFGVGIWDKHKNFIQSSVSLHCFIFFVSFIGLIIFNILDSVLNFLEKNNVKLYYGRNGYESGSSGPRFGSSSGKMMLIRPDLDHKTGVEIVQVSKL